MMLNLAPLVPQGQTPVWIGNGFQIGNEFHQVLSYSENQAGWDDALTSFHEEHAGEDHFIEIASRTNAITQIQRFCTAKNPTILEIGCSSGFLLKQLPQYFPEATIMGADVVYQPLMDLAKQYPNIPLMRFDLVNCPLPDNSIDALILLNVLEHIEDDAKAMQQIKRILKPGGIAIFEVPAGPHLYDVYDKLLKHFRRYCAQNFKQLVQQTDLDIVMSSHLGFFLYPGFAWVKKRNQRLFNENEGTQRESVAKNISRTSHNKLFNALMTFELALGQYVSYPTGIRCLLTCKKRG